MKYQDGKDYFFYINEGSVHSDYHTCKYDMIKYIKHFECPICNIILIPYF